MQIRAIAIILLLLVLITVPYLNGARAAGQDYVFGGFLFNPIDGNSYLAKMYQGWLGEWRFTLPYTAEPGEGAYLFLYYLFLGHLARILSIPLLWMFHIARLLGAVILMLVLYRFLSAPLFGSRWMNWVFALGALGAGMGWLVLPFGLFTSDFWVAEAYPFLSAYANPHFPLSLALLLLLLTFTTSTPGGVRQSRWWKNGWFAFPVALFLSLLAPFGVAVGLVVLGGLIIWLLAERLFVGKWIKARPRKPALTRAADSVEIDRLSTVIGRLFWIVLGGIPLSLYAIWIVRTDPVMAGWNAQNLTPTPPLWDLALSLLPALALALVAMGLFFTRRIGVGRIYTIWVVLGFLLLYSPFGLQRRFMMGLFVPIVGLAGISLEYLLANFSAAGKRIGLLALVVFALALPTNLLILATGQHGVQTHDPLLYMTLGEAQAFEWIAGNTPLDALILCAPETGMYIPAHTGRRVIYGHPFETVNAEVEFEAVERFFKDQAGDGAPLMQSEYLRQRDVDYVFYGPREENLGSLPAVEELNEVYSAEGVIIYQVKAMPQ